MYEQAKASLEALGYQWQEGDGALLNSAIEKAENTVKNDCNLDGVPEGLVNIAVDMAVGEFLLVKKTVAPNHLCGLDLGTVVAKTIQEGDTSVSFAIGDGTLTAEQRLDNLIRCLLTEGKSEFSCYRKLRW